MSDHALEATLINALNKLQYAALDKTFLSNQDAQKPELITEQYFAFAIAEQHFVVKADCFCEVFVNNPIAALPNAPQLLLGLCNIRSTLVPVYQLYSLTERKPPSKKVVFTIGKGDKSVALLIDGLPSSIALGQQHLATNTPDAQALLQPLITHRYWYQQKKYHLLDGQVIGEQLLAMAQSDKQKMSTPVEHFYTA